jgi:signal transduction histidine kinase
LVTGEPYAIADVSTDPLFAPWKEVALQEGYQSAICMPLLAAGESVGTLHLCLPEPHSFKPSEIRLLNIVCQEVGLAIERARLYDQARAANDRKSQFLAAMSHELRTPLTAILGFTNILLEQLNGPLTAEQQWQLRVVSASAQHVMLLINDALDLAKIEAGKMDWQRETVDAASVAAETIEMLTPLAEAKGLTLQWRDDGPPLNLYTERRRCKQILVNLVSNAIKFTSRGGVTLSAARDPDDSSYAGVRVTDTGVGIRPEDVPRLFHDFEQLEELPASSTGSSSGLGLSLSRKLARLMGGDVTVESTFGQGSTFTLRLEAAP